MLVDVCRKVDGVDSIDGFILAASKNWLLLKGADALQPDGFWILRRDKVISLQRSKFQAFKEQMMKRSGLLAQLGALPPVELTDIHTILRSFIRNKRLCILFTENKKEWWRIHCAVIDVSPTRLCLHPFTGAGQWDVVRTSGRWKPRAITAIRFDSHYLQLYEKYAPRESREGSSSSKTLS